MSIRVVGIITTVVAIGLAFYAFALSGYLAETETAETRLAWQALTEQINSATQAEDSYVLIKNGSTIQIGTFRMVFHTNRRPQRIETGN